MTLSPRRHSLGPSKMGVHSPSDFYRQDDDDDYIDSRSHRPPSPVYRSSQIHHRRRGGGHGHHHLSHAESIYYAADCLDYVDAGRHHHPYRDDSGYRLSRSETRVHDKHYRSRSAYSPSIPSSSMSGSTLTLPPDCEPLQPLAKPKVEEELCTICGDRASGYHYNALSCEGCKGFFRRSITRGANYSCKYGGNCEMDMWMRRKCQACRLKQCRTVGMKEECLLSERQCVARNARRQTRQKSYKPRGQVRHRLGTTSTRSILSSLEPMTPGTVDGDRQSPHCRSPLERLSDEHRELVTRIVSYQDKYELPTPEDTARVAALNIASTIAQAVPSDAVFGHMVEMTILVTRLVVEFAKHLPGFQGLCKEDQITLLKGSASEVMMLRTARRFDPETNTVVFGDGTPFTQNCMAFGGLQGFVDSMFDFSRGMASLTVDNAEYALLTALCIFSDRPGIRDTHIIENIQEVYSEVLLSYVSHRRVYGSHFMAKLLMKLVELRTLSSEHSQCLYRLTIEKGSLPPLLNEYFDIPENQKVAAKPKVGAEHHG